MRLSGFIFNPGLQTAPQSAGLPTRPLGLALRAVVCSQAHSGGLKVALWALIEFFKTIPLSCLLHCSKKNPKSRVNSLRFAALRPWTSEPLFLLGE